MDEFFSNRQQAGQKLAAEIFKKYSGLKETVVLGLPRGGVIVAYEVAKKMGWPLDIIVTRKIGHPFNPEYAVAAVSEHDIVLNPNEEVDPNYLLNQSVKERKEILRRTLAYRPSPAGVNLKNKTVFLVDDGIATGLTMKAAIAEVKSKKPKKIIVASPVAAIEITSQLEKNADEILILKTPPDFSAVGQFYENFPQTTDQEVIELLKSVDSR